MLSDIGAADLVLDTHLHDLRTVTMSRRPRNYPLRPQHSYDSQMHTDEFKASSSNAPSSSLEHPLPPSNFPLNANIQNIDFDEEDNTDTAYVSPSDTHQFTKFTKAEAVFQTLQSYDNFSFRQFLETAFAKNAPPEIKHKSGMFISGGGPLSMMEVWYDANKPEMVKWVMEKAACICEKEARDLTNRASQGPHATDANILRLTSSMVMVKDVETFRVPLLLLVMCRARLGLKPRAWAGLQRARACQNSSLALS
jgi:hypothetical protein